MDIHPSNFPRITRPRWRMLAAEYRNNNGELFAALWREEIAHRILEDWPALPLSFIRDVVVMAGQDVLDGLDWVGVEGRARRFIYETEGVRNGGK